jgi:hypothetical protein
MNASQEQFGERRLASFLLSRSHETAASFADALLDELSLWSGSDEERQDDLTLLAVHFRDGAADGA